MFYTDITVDLPLKKRISWNKNKYYVTEIFSRKGKNSVDDCVVVGIAISKDSNLMYPNNKYFERHPEMIDILEGNKLEEKNYCPCQSVGQHLLIDAICEITGLDQILVESFPGFSQEIEACLKYYLSMRNTDIDTFKAYGYDHYLGTNYIPDLSKLFNERITHENIKIFLSKWLTHCLSLSTSNEIEVDFDSTNTNTNSANIELAERGKAKTDENLPQVNFSYLIDRKTGLPMHFDIFYGSIVDMEHCKNYVKKVEAIKKDTKFMFCMDRGYYTKPFLTSIYNKYNFCVMGKDNSKFDEFINLYPEQNIKKSENRIYGSNYGVKFKSLPFKEWEHGELFIYLYYNSEKSNSSAICNLDKLETVAKQLNGKKDLNGNIQRTWQKKLNITIDSKTKIITEAKVNYEQFDESNKKAGYFYIVSDKEMSPAEMLSFYRHRDVVEKNFMLARSQEDLAKTYAQNDNCYEAKTFIGFLCSIIRSNIINTMEPYFFQYRNETTQSIINEMGKIKVDNLNGTIVQLCPLTNKQKQIMSFYKLTNKNVLSLIEEFKNIDFPN